jgi:hypothetical protein
MTRRQGRALHNAIAEMGVVYQARQRGLTRVVALKMILAGAHCRDEELARFRNEAVAVAELQHPNNVQLYEVGEDDGQPFFSLEFVDGPSLAKKINGMPQPPAEAARFTRLLELVRTQEPIAPSQFQPKVPRDLETICLKCLQKEIGKRYATAAELGEDLRRFESGEPFSARPVGRVERLWRWCRRNRKVAALCGALGVLLVAWSATSTLLYRLARANERDALNYARQASDNEAVARRNAETARKSEQQAQASADLAGRRADTSFAIASDAINNMVRLGDQMLRRLQARHEPARADAEWLRLRNDLIGLLSKEIVPMAERIEGQDVTAFAVLATHQQLGDMLKKCGLGAAARNLAASSWSSVHRGRQPAHSFGP